MKILVPVDGSEFTTRALEFLARHADLFGSRHAYHVLTVVPPIPANPSRHLGPEAVASYHDEQAERILRPVREFADRQQWQCVARVVAGSPGREIARVAAEGQHDLIVMGSNGHGAVGSVVLGSVASAVLAHCRTPVLLVR